MHIAIIGLGLIGGSIGLALKQSKKRQYRITGYARKQNTAAKALKTGAVDSAASSLKDAVEHANIVLIATPVLAIKDIFIEIAPHLPVGCIVTDAGSTKSQVCRWAKDLLPAHVNFIGGHPMAGKETAGIESADHALFENRIYCLVYDPATAKFAVKAVTDMAHDLGAKVLTLDAADHDLYVAGISHLPFLMSVALTGVTSASPQWKAMSELASSGYRDMTRLTAGSTEMYRDICLTNHEHISLWIDRYIEELRRIQHYIDSNDPAVQDIFDNAKEQRRRWWRDKK